MNIITKLISTAIEKGVRIAKVLRLGDDDVQTAQDAAPWGIDGNPLPDTLAVYAETLDKGAPVIVGYINEEQLAGVGELRTYATDSEGNVVTHVWLKNDGTMELGGNVDNAVRYGPLNDELQNLITFLNQQLALIASGISAGGGSYSPGTAQLDISGAKINEIKTL